MTKDDEPAGPSDATVPGTDAEGPARTDAGPRDVARVKRRRVRRDARRPEATPQDATASQQVMEPMTVLRDEGAGASKAPGAAQAEARAAGSPIVEVDVEREVIGTALYRERRIVEEVVEEDVAPPTREERRRGRARRRERSRPRSRPRPGGGFRGTLAYKAFYDLVCNRVGLVLAGFGTVLLLFVMLYDPMRRVPLEFGPKHLLAVAIAGVVYGVGMVFEMLRAWSWECEGAEEEMPEDVSVLRPPSRARREGGGDAPIPLVPEDALSQLGGGGRTDDDGAGRGRGGRRRRGRNRSGG